MNRLTPILLLFLAMGSIQFGASIAKGLFPIAGIAGASALRLFFAGSILCLVFRPWRAKIPKAARMDLAFYGASLGLMNLSFYYALNRIPLGIAVALEFTGPLFVSLISGKTKLDYLWSALAAIGIALLMPIKHSSNLDMLGIALALLAGFFWGLYIISGKRLGDQINSGTAASAGMGIAALIIVPWGLFLNGQEMLQTSAWPIGLFVGVFGSALPYTLEMVALRRMPAKTFSILMSLEPAVASLIGLLFLSESLSILQWSAICCIILAAQGSSLASRPKKLLV